MRNILLLFAVFLIPAFASAHGGTPSFEAESGPYLIDIGYNTTGIRPGEEVTFDFDLFRDVNGVQSFADFELIRVEFTRGSETVHSAELVNQESFIPMMKYTFQEEGDYQLKAAYVQSGAVIADASFDVHVGENNGTAGRAMNTLTYVVAGLLIVFAGGVAIASFVRSKRA